MTEGLLRGRRATPVRNNGSRELLLLRQQEPQGIIQYLPVPSRLPGKAQGTAIQYRSPLPQKVRQDII